MTESLAADKNLAVLAGAAISTDDVILIFEDMMPGQDVLMRRDMEQMFPSIETALKRDVSEQQAIATLRKKWPNAHVATITKLFNAERERRLQHGEQIECKPFGSPRKTKIRRATMTVETCGPARIPQTTPDATDGDQHEVSA